MSNAAVVAEGRMYEFTTQSGADTVAVGRKLADLLAPPAVAIAAWRPRDLAKLR